MSNPQPPKLNYVKGRQKSKAKNEPESQQKISFEAESSTDIFAHLNQDNLNYIKKQLKTKKSHKHQRGKSTQDIKNDQAKLHKQADTQKSLRQQKMFEKYKNEDQVTQRDSRDEETIRETEINDSIDFEQESGKTREHHASSMEHNQLKRKQRKLEQKQKHRYIGLQPPPLTYTKYQEGIRSTQSQKIKQSLLSVQFNGIQYGERRQKTHQKNPFNDYELKSQGSNNPIGNSTVSVQNQLSQDLSINMKPSQFIDHLQNYIEELNSTPQKTSKMYKTNNLYSPEVEEKESAEKNFRKNKSYRNKQHAIQSQRSDRSNSYYPISMKSHPKHTSLVRNSQNQQEESLQHFNSPQTKIPQSTFKNYKSSVSNQPEQSFHNKSPNFQNLKKQLDKQKYYCTKLALQLQKYKLNEQKHQNEITLLNKTIQILKLEIHNVKEVYQHDSQQIQQILEFIHAQNIQIQKQQNKNTLHSQSEKYQHNHLRNQRQIPFQPSSKHQSLYRTTNPTHNQFQELMLFSRDEPLYNNLNPRVFNHLIDQFKRGQQNYHQKYTSRNPLSKLNLSDAVTHKNPKTSERFLNQSLKHEQLRSNYYRSKDRLNEKQSPQTQMNNNENRQAFQPRIRKTFIKDNQRQPKFQRNPYKNTSYKTNTINNNKHLISSSSNESIQQKQKSSLQKLKQQYQSFKFQINTSKPQHKQFRNSSFTQQISPKQFTRIFVK